MADDATVAQQFLPRWRGIMGSERRIALLLGVGAAVVGGGTLIALGPPSNAGAADPPTTTVVHGARSIHGATNGPLAVAIGTELRGAEVTSIRAVEDDRRSYTELSAVHDDGSTYGITVYRRFDPAELDAAGLERTEVSGGVAWTGIESPDLVSVYLLTDDGIGVWVSRRSDGGSTARVEDLRAVAQRLAASPAVVDEARR